MSHKKTSLLLFPSVLLLTLGLTGCASTMHSMHTSAFVVPQPPGMHKLGVRRADRPSARANILAPEAHPIASTSPGGQIAPTSSVNDAPASLGADLSPVQAAPELPPGQTLSVAALLGSVDGRPLFVQTIFNMVNRELQREASESRTKKYFEQQAIATLARAIHSKVDTMLLLSEARRRLSSDRKKQIEAYVRVREAKLLAQYMGSEERANRALKRQGTSLDRRMEAIRDKATLELFINHVIYPQIVITRRDLIRYYRRHIAQFTRHASVSLYTITYPVIRQWPRDPNDPTHTQPISHPTAAQLHTARQEALAYCRHLEKEIRHGANFAFLAEDNSVDYAAANGGHIANVRPDELSNQKLARLITSLQAHQMAPPMLITDTKNPRRDVVLIVKLGKVVHHHVLPFDAVEKKILHKLSNREYQRLISAYYNRLYGGESLNALEGMARTAAAVAVAKYWPHG